MALFFCMFIGKIQVESLFPLDQVRIFYMTCVHLTLPIRFMELIVPPFSGTPQDSGISLQVVLELGPYVPLFGVCMGLQCMGEAFGGECFSPYSCILLQILNFTTS